MSNSFCDDLVAYIVHLFHVVLAMSFSEDPKFVLDGRAGGSSPGLHQDLYHLLNEGMRAVTVEVVEPVAKGA
jgi:hypothetical protein